MDTKCCDYISTYSISKGLYVERYRTFCAGVFGELTSCYITDSSVERNDPGSFDFYNVTDRRKVDTVKVETYLLTELQKGKLIKVCK